MDEKKIGNENENENEEETVDKVGEETTETAADAVKEAQEETPAENTEDKAEETQVKNPEEKAEDKQIEKPEGKSSGKKALPAIIAAVILCAALVICAATGVFNKKPAGGTEDTKQTETTVSGQESGENGAASESAATDENSASVPTDTAAANGSDTAAPADAQSADEAANNETAEPVGEDEKDVSDLVGSNGALTVPQSGVGNEDGIDSFKGATKGSGNTASYSYTFEKYSDEGVPPEGGKISIELSFPLFSSDSVNVSPLNDEIAAKTEITRNSYARMFEAADGDEQSDPTYCRLALESKIVTSTDSVVSILLTTNTAIGTGSRDTYATVNFDVAQARALNLYDLFPEDADYETVLAEQVGSNVQIDTSKFLLSSEGLTLFTTVSSGASQVTVPYSALDGIMFNTYKAG